MNCLWHYLQSTLQLNSVCQVKYANECFVFDRQGVHFPRWSQAMPLTLSDSDKASSYLSFLYTYLSEHANQHPIKVAGQPAMPQSDHLQTDTS